MVYLKLISHRSDLEQQENVAYILIGSAITVMREMVEEHQHPLYGQFQEQASLKKQKN